MQDFNSFVKNNSNGKTNVSGGLNSNLVDMIKNLANKYDGASEEQLLKAIYVEAERNRKNGTLSDADLDNFAKMISPMLDDKMRKKLNAVVSKLKKK